MIKVLFVCLGNICRSPTAHGIFLQKVSARGLSQRVYVDSAGTGNWHVGEPPDHRTIKVATTRGYDLSQLKARQVKKQDFIEFDYILAMDSDNLVALQAMCPENSDHKIDLFLKYGKSGVTNVPDPYYGGSEGFEKVIDLIEEAADELLAYLESTYF